MITDQGQQQLLKLVSGKVGFYANKFIVGISDKTLSTDITQMDFAWATCPITSSYIDYDLNQVVFHGSLDKGLSGEINEIGLISQSKDFIRSGLPSTIVYNFDPNELWHTDGEFEVTTSGSVGLNTFKLTNVGNDQVLAKTVSAVNVSRYDTIKLKITSADVQKMRISLKNNETESAHLDISLIDGKNTYELLYGSMTKTNNFEPTAINEINFKVLQSSGNATLDFDVISMFSEANGGLVTRSVLANTQYKRYGSSMEVEYAVAF